MSNQEQFLSRVHEELIVSVSADQCIVDAIADRAKAVYGDDWFDHWRKAVRAADTEISLKNTSMLDACKFAERIRIAKPDAHVNISSPKPGGDFICNVTWNCQMEEFPVYEVYTEEGASILAALKQAEQTDEMMKDADMPSFFAY
jgi:hypothetical protein